MKSIHKKPVLRFPEFEDQWREEKLGDVIERIQGGGTPSRENLEYYKNGNIPWVTVKDLSDENYKDTTIEYITDAGLLNSSAKLIETGSFIISTRMGLGRGFINKVPMAINQDLKALKPKKEIDSEFLLYWYKKNKDEVQKLGVGSTVKGIDLQVLKSLRIQFGLIDEQKKIASFLTAIDKKIEQLKKKKELLEQYKKGVMQQIFSQEIRFKDDDGRDYPEWEEKAFGELFTFYNTNSLSRSQLNYEFGDIKNIHYGDIHTSFKSNFSIEEEHVPYINPDVDTGKLKDEQFCRRGDLVIADASEDYKDVGKAIEIIETGNERLVAGTHTYIARPQQDAFSLGFPGYMMQTHFVRRQIMEKATGISVLGISKGNLSKVIIRYPVLSEQKKIAALLTNLDKKINSLAKEIVGTSDFKKGLLQQMFV